MDDIKRRVEGLEIEYMDIAANVQACEYSGAFGERARRGMDLFMRRGELVQEYAWAIPCREAIFEIAKLGPIIEVGAGTGYWAMLLASVGVDIIAFDNSLVGTVKQSNVFYGDETFVSLFSTGRNLFLCWPLNDDSMALDILSKFAGRYVIFVGEGKGGCTGCEKFHDALEMDFDLVKDVEIPQWFGIHDCLLIWERKRTVELGRYQSETEKKAI